MAFWVVLLRAVGVLVLAWGLVSVPQIGTAVIQPVVIAVLCFAAAVGLNTLHRIDTNNPPKWRAAPSPTAATTTTRPCATCSHQLDGI